MGPAAFAAGDGNAPLLSAKMHEWVDTIQRDPDLKNVLWVLKDMNDFAANPEGEKQITGKLGNRFKEMRKDMVQASAFEQRITECAGKEMHAKAAAEDLSARFTLRTIQNRKDCIVCNAVTDEKKEFVDKLGKPFVSSSFFNPNTNKNFLSVAEVMGKVNQDFGFDNPKHDDYNELNNDAADLLSGTVLETQKNVLRNFIYFKEHFDIGGVKPKTAADYVHALFFACYNPETGAYQPPLIGCGRQSYADTESELIRFAEKEMANVKERYGGPKNVDQIYEDLKPLFDSMDDEDIQYQRKSAEVRMAKDKYDREKFDQDFRNGISYDGIKQGLPKLDIVEKNQFFRTRSAIDANLGHESAFLFQTDALSISAAMKKENRSSAARKELIRAAIQETVTGTKDYSDFIKNKGGIINGFNHQKDTYYLNKSTNILIRTSPHAVIETLYEHPELIHANCDAIKQMADSYKQSLLEKSLMWGGILIAGVTIGFISGGILIPGYVVAAGTFTAISGVGTMITTMNLANNVSHQRELADDAKTLRGADPAVDRYSNPKIQADLAEVRLQQKKVSSRIMWNVIDITSFLAMPVVMKAFEKLMKLFPNKNPNEMFFPVEEKLRYISTKGTDGKMVYAKIIGTAADGAITKIKYLKGGKEMIVLPEELGKFVVSPKASVYFNSVKESSTALAESPTAKFALDSKSYSGFYRKTIEGKIDLWDLANIGYGVYYKGTRLNNGYALPTDGQIEPSPAPGSSPLPPRHRRFRVHPYKSQE